MSRCPFKGNMIWPGCWALFPPAVRLRSFFVEFACLWLSVLLVAVSRASWTRGLFWLLAWRIGRVHVLSGRFLKAISQVYFVLALSDVFVLLSLLDTLGSVCQLVCMKHLPSPRAMLRIVVVLTDRLESLPGLLDKVCNARYWIRSFTRVQRSYVGRRRRGHLFILSVVYRSIFIILFLASVSLIFSSRTRRFAAVSWLMESKLRKHIRSHRVRCKT